jgi:DNA-binding response OmpR family regulator
MNRVTSTLDDAARVLLITSDEEAKNFINNLMLLKRIRAGVTESLESASNFLNSNVPPDAVILDLELSESLALEFLRQIRRHEKLTRMPILVLIDIPDPTLVRQALDAGANRYITKSFMSQNLLPIIQELVSQARAQAANVPRLTASLRQSTVISTDSGG